MILKPGLNDPSCRIALRPVDRTSLADRATAFISGAVIGVDQTPELVGRVKIVHETSGDDFTDRVRWLNLSTGAAHVYLIDDRGIGYTMVENGREVAAYEIVTSAWRVWIDGKEIARL